MQLDFRFCLERLNCYDAEKRTCLSTVRRLAQAHTILRRDGVLALEVLQRAVRQEGGWFLRRRSGILYHRQHAG